MYASTATIPGFGSRDLATDTTARLTLGKNDRSPVWSADGKKIYYQSLRETGNLVVERAVDGSGAERTVVSGRRAFLPESISPDGRILLLTATLGADGSSFFVPVAGGPPVPVSSRTMSPSFSPDGRWIVFHALEDVFVSAVPKEAGGAGTPGTWQISVGGGAQPLWRGKEIFYVAPDGKLMTVTVEAAEGIRVGTPAALFDSGMDGTEYARFRRYDVAPDGKHFLMREDVNVGRESPLTVMLNWEKLIP